MKKLSLTPRERRRKEEEGKQKLRLWLGSWVYNSHNQPAHVKAGMLKTQIAKWKGLCYHTNKHQMILDPMAFERLAKDKKVIHNIEVSLGFAKPGIVQKIIGKVKSFAVLKKSTKQAVKNKAA